VALFRGRMAFLSGDGSNAPKLLLHAAKRFELLDAGLARETYLEAINAACFAGSFTGAVDAKRVALAAKAAPPSSQPARPSELLLDGLALLAIEGPAGAAPMLRRAGSAFRSQETSAEEDLRWLRQACATASLLWDNESWYALASRWAQLARDAGALTLLSQSLNSLANIRLFGGELRASAALIAEAEAINELTGSSLAPYCAAYLAALRGRQLEASALIEASIKEATAGGQGMVVAFARWASATLYNGLARYDRALAAAEQASEHPLDWRSHLTLHELIEAAARNGTPERGAATLERLSQTTGASGSNWALAIEARSRALLSEGHTADALYVEALGRLGPTGLGTEVARTHLLYGEWLRRERRRLDAREQLRAAHEMFITMGAEAFAERARIELKATGETVRKRVVETPAELTAQEAQVCRLAAEGARNAEIGARLFISASTVDYHLRKAFRKLGISSRTQLERRLAQ
jgi:DNA-binding CsgD family transcriptional regulator